MRSLVLGTVLGVLAGWLLRRARVWRCAAWVAVGAHVVLGHERLSARTGNIAVAEYGGYFVDTVLVR
jgi:putative component of membrane protein insertase Oxa1/YidC/SpoIIIJ protein YidD